MTEAGWTREHRRAALIAAVAVFLISFGLLAASVFDYRGHYRFGLPRSIPCQGGEHWLVPWDTINFGPGGRPNLQGPLFQAAVGNLGKLLGGSGSDYVRQRLCNDPAKPLPNVLSEF